MQVKWRPSLLGSDFHAASALPRSLRLTNSAVARAIRPATLALNRWAEAHAMPPNDWWNRITECSCQVDRVDKLRARLAPCGLASGNDDAVQCGSEIARLWDAFGRAVPRLETEMLHRVRPLSQQWAARGPGIEKVLAERLGRSFPEQAVVYLVYPVLGGRGQRLSDNRSIRLEALLTDALPGLPEVVRLAWLLSPLELELNTPTTSNQFASSLALTMVVLDAGQQVELNRCDQETVQTALTGWHLVSDEQADMLAEKLVRWWKSVECRVDWRRAVEQIEEF